MISIQICINNDNIASVFIVSPPSYNVGRDEPNNTLIALLILVYHKFIKSLIFNNSESIENAVTSSSLMAFPY